MHSMKTFLLFLVFTTIILMSESFFLLSGLLLIKAALIKGVIIGGLIGAAARARGKRDVDVQGVEPMLATASQNDVDDCAKKLICSLSSRDVTTLAEDEALILSLFGRGDLDVSKSTIEFDLAAKLGQKAGSSHCNSVYSRCPYNVDQLMDVMRDPNTGNLI